TPFRARYLAALAAAPMWSRLRRRAPPMRSRAASCARQHWVLREPFLEDAHLALDGLRQAHADAKPPLADSLTGRAQLPPQPLTLRPGLVALLVHVLVRAVSARSTHRASQRLEGLLLGTTLPAEDVE